MRSDAVIEIYEPLNSFCLCAEEENSLFDAKAHDRLMTLSALRWFGES